MMTTTDEERSLIGRRMSTVAVVVAAVTVGGVAGAFMGIPGLSGASSTSTTSPAKSNAAPHDGHHFRGFPGALGVFPGAIGGGPGVLDAGAKALKLSTKDLLTKLSDGKTTIADIAKAQGVDLKTVTDAMEAVAKDDISKLVNNPWPVPPKFDGPDGPGLKGGLGFGRHIGGKLDTVAKALKLSTKDLLTKLSDGRTTIADIAETQNVDINSIIDTLVNDAKLQADAAVKDGHLTQDQANQIESALKDTITKMVNSPAPIGGRHVGGFRFGRHGGHFEFGGPGPAGPAAGIPPAPAT
jgi:hypothetical protein